MQMMNRRSVLWLALLLSLCLSLAGCIGPIEPDTPDAPSLVAPDGFDLAAIPAYAGQPYVSLNGGKPYFTASEITAKAYESYGELDALGRCTQAIACVGDEIMPTEERGSISSVKPTGWHSVTYDCVSGGDLYNRCHLIAFQLTGENANRENLVTGTTYLNHRGMLPFENMVADYVKETGNHVMYRVTPIFQGNDLVCVGVLMEGYSVEDEGEGICFNVYCYNVQPGVEIDYATGASWLSGETPPPETTEGSVGEAPEGATYVVNTSSSKYHKLTCRYVKTMTSNMEYSIQPKEALEAAGYEPCGVCKP